MSENLAVVTPRIRTPNYDISFPSYLGLSQVYSHHLNEKSFFLRRNEWRYDFKNHQSVEIKQVPLVDSKTRPTHFGTNMGKQ